MGWSERAVVEDGKSAASPLRVVVEFMGEAAAPRVEQSAARVVPGHLRTVQLVGWQPSSGSDLTLPALTTPGPDTDSDIRIG